MNAGTRSLLFAALSCLVPAGLIFAEPPPEPDMRILGEWWTEGRGGRIKCIQARDGTFRGITT